jgi:hypothetical protein
MSVNGVNSAECNTRIGYAPRMHLFIPSGFGRRHGAAQSLAAAVNVAAEYFSIKQGALSIAVPLFQDMHAHGTGTKRTL